MAVVISQDRAIPFFATIVILFGGCAGVAPSSPAAPAVQAISAEEAVLNFDSAWNRIANTYYDPDFRGLDWQAVRSELRPLAEAARTLPELRAVIRDMLGRIGESHFALIPGDVADALDPDVVRSDPDAGPGTAGLELRVVDGELVVFRGPATGESGQVRPGWIVTRIDEVVTAGLFDAAARVTAELGERAAAAQVVNRAHALLGGAPGTTVRVDFRDGADQSLTLDLTRIRVPGQPVRFGNLPTLFSAVEHQRLNGTVGCVGLIRFTIWMPVLNPEFERAMLALHDCDGIIIDLRGNPGGVAGMVMGISGYFVARVDTLGTMRNRQGEVRFVSIPRLSTSSGDPWRPFAGPVAILTDAFSGSTSEIFTGGMQQIGRARVFGETTAGQALPALMLRLPSQDVLYHAVADFVTPNGARIEGAGVSPDTVVPLQRADLLAGRDASLDAAVSWIRSIATSTP